MPKALITCMHLVRHFEAYRSQYKDAGVEAIVPTLTGQQFSASEMAQHIQGMDVVIAGDDFMDAHVLELGQASGLKAVIKWGIGTDGIDKAHATRLGLPVYNTPGVFGEEVGDLAMSHLLMLTRKTHLMDASVKAGNWLKSEGRSLAGLTAGVLGLGSIGQGICRRAKAFGMTVLGHDVAQFEVAGVERADFDAVLAAADVIFVACALTPENRHLIGADALSKIKPGALLINVARGPLVDQAALVAALEDRRLAGAGLDVFETEPLPSDAPLRRFADRCTFSTHNGSNTIEAVMRINQMTTDIAFDVLGIRKAAFDIHQVI